jgi:hypothetical protein
VKKFHILDCRFHIFLGAISCCPLYLFLAEKARKRMTLPSVLKKLHKKQRFTVSRKIPKSKGINFAKKKITFLKIKIFLRFILLLAKNTESLYSTGSNKLDG